MGKWKAGFIIFLAAVFAFMTYSLFKEHRSFESSVEKLRASREELENENRALAQKIEYFKLPENLLKEARSRFNFTKQGEKLLIVIPKQENSTSSPE